VIRYPWGCLAVIQIETGKPTGKEVVALHHANSESMGESGPDRVPSIYEIGSRQS